VRPVDHFAAFCASLTQSEDRWESQPLRLERWQRRFSQEALEDWGSVRVSQGSCVPRARGVDLYADTRDP
jgi:hypothetical protein